MSIVSVCTVALESQVQMKLKSGFADVVQDSSSLLEYVRDIKGVPHQHERCAMERKSLLRFIFSETDACLCAIYWL